jgi:uncharacterized protein with GYD domain
VATYINLLRYTEQGIKNIKQAPGRLDDAKKAWKAMGAEIKAYYLVMGQYDAVIVSEAPNDETMAKLLLTLGSLGNVGTETMRAFPEDEYRKLIAGLP